jgi:hypothetical protein
MSVITRAAPERLFDRVVFKGPFDAPQLTGEKKPAFGSGGEAPAVPLIATRLCQVFFGYRAALGRVKEHAAPGTVGALYSRGHEFESV